MKLFRRSGWYILILIAVLAVLYEANRAFVWFGDRLTLTAAAAVYVPTDEERYVRENGGYRSDRVPAANEGRELTDNVRERKIAFRNGSVKLFMDYGPYEIRGRFDRADIAQAAENVRLEEDWPFAVCLFNTSSGRSFSAYMDLEVYADRTEAEATLYLFYEGYAHPVTATWKGGIGEEIVLILEI